MMAKEIMILISLICFSAMVIGGQAPPPIPPRLEKGLSAEETRKALDQWRTQGKQAHTRNMEQYSELMMRQAWKRFLRVAEQQWQTIEPNVKRQQALSSEARVHALGGGGLNSPKYEWKKHSEGTSSQSPKAPHEMSDGERLVDELIDLLRDENSKDEEIRKKIEAIQQVRAKARAALPQAKKELAAVLTNPRQEAIFLVLGSID